MYDDWLEEVENSIWLFMGAKLSDFENIDFEDLFEQGYSPDDVANYLFEEEEG